MKNGTWICVPADTTSMTSSAKTVIRTKLTSGGSLDKQKVRLVAHGLLKNTCIDYFDKFSLVLFQNHVHTFPHLDVKD